MADQLATAEDVASLLERDDLDSYKTNLLVDCATAVVQATCGQRITLVEDDTIELDLDEYSYGLHLRLPERPVVEVATVTIGATAVTDYSVQTRRARLWRANGWRSTLVNYPDQPSTVTVVYTHGFAPGDQRLELARRAVLGLVAGAFDGFDGATSERIDDYAVTYEAMVARMDTTPTLASLLRRQYGHFARSIQLIRG